MDRISRARTQRRCSYGHVPGRSCSSFATCLCKKRASAKIHRLRIKKSMARWKTQVISYRSLESKETFSYDVFLSGRPDTLSLLSCCGKGYISSFFSRVSLLASGLPAGGSQRYNLLQLAMIKTSNGRSESRQPMTAPFLTRKQDEAHEPECRHVC